MASDEDPISGISKALAHEQFVQEKLARGRVVYLRNPDGSFTEVPPDDSDDGLNPAKGPGSPEPKGPKVTSAARQLEPDEPWPDGDIRSNLE